MITQDCVLMRNYMTALVNKFYKILPLRESGGATLDQYTTSLFREMSGYGKLINGLDHDDRYASLLAMLEYMIEFDPDVSAVRSDVFKAINIIKALRDKYFPEGA